MNACALYRPVGVWKADDALNTSLPLLFEATILYGQIAWIFAASLPGEDVTAAQVRVALKVCLSHFAFIALF